MGARMLSEGTPVDDTVKLEAEIEKIRKRLRKLPVAHFVDDALSDDEYRAAHDPRQEQLRAAEGRVRQANEDDHIAYTRRCREARVR